MAQRMLVVEPATREPLSPWALAAAVEQAGDAPLAISGPHGLLRIEWPVARSESGSLCPNIKLKEEFDEIRIVHGFGVRVWQRLKPVAAGRRVMPVILAPQPRRPHRSTARNTCWPTSRTEPSASSQRASRPRTANQSSSWVALAERRIRGLRAGPRSRLLDASKAIVAEGSESGGTRSARAIAARSSEQACTTLVKVVDEGGKCWPPIRASYLGLAANDMVVVRGKANKDESGNFVVLADGVYVRR